MPSKFGINTRYMLWLMSAIKKLPLLLNEWVGDMVRVEVEGHWP